LFKLGIGKRQVAVRIGISRTSVRRILPRYRESPARRIGRNGMKQGSENGSEDLTVVYDNDPILPKLSFWNPPAESNPPSMVFL
jgi:hypothetical protein